MNPEPDQLVGTVLADRYRIERVVGAGGVGSVYQATQLGLDRRVAIKVLRPELSESGNAIARFAREARTAAKLQHPNIVTVHDFGTTPDGRAFLVMEFLSGLNLAQWIRRNKPTPAVKAVGYLTTVCGAIDSLHKSGIIHRDIKPSNIVIAENASGPAVVKVVDFGLVRAGLTEAHADITGGLVLGTPEFMAPELFTGQRPDERSDVYALGITAYETLTGDLPFGMGPFKEMYQRHSSDIPRRPSMIRADLPESSDSALFRAMHKDPKKRYQTAAEFAEALNVAFSVGAGSSQEHPRIQVILDTTEVAADEHVTRLGSILVVEDDKLVRDVLVEGLEMKSFEVVTAADGIEAFLLLGKRAFDLILSDVAMPNLDGLTLLRLKSEKGIGTPVIFLTSSVSEHDQNLASSLGASGFVTKPVEMDVLVPEIRRVLGIVDEAGD